MLFHIEQLALYTLIPVPYISDGILELKAAI